MKVEEAIKEKVSEVFQPIHIELVNESDQHSGPPGRESHFHMIVVSSFFETLNRVKRQQAIYKELQIFFDAGLHALSLYTYTPSEWELRKKGLIQSPNCSGKKSNRI